MLPAAFSVLILIVAVVALSVFAGKAYLLGKANERKLVEWVQTADRAVDQMMDDVERTMKEYDLRIKRWEEGGDQAVIKEIRTFREEMKTVKQRLGI